MTPLQTLRNVVNRSIANGSPVITEVSIDYEKAKIAKARLESILDEASKAMRDFPRDAMGLTHDSVKFSPDYKAKRIAFDRAMRAVKEFNQPFIRSYGKQWRDELHAKRLSL